MYVSIVSIISQSNFYGGSLWRCRRAWYALHTVIVWWTFWTYRSFHKTLPRSSAFVKWISVRFYETDCTQLLRSGSSRCSGPGSPWGSRSGASLPSSAPSSDSAPSSWGMVVGASGPTPCAGGPAPCAGGSSPCAGGGLTPCGSDPTPCVGDQATCVSGPTPCASDPTPCARCPALCTGCPTPCTAPPFVRFLESAV